MQRVVLRARSANTVAWPSEVMPLQPPVSKCHQSGRPASPTLRSNTLSTAMTLSSVVGSWKQANRVWGVAAAAQSRLNVDEETGLVLLLQATAVRTSTRSAAGTE